MLKRLLSLVLTTIMILSAFPVCVNAEEVTEPTDSADTYSPTEDDSDVTIPTEPATELESKRKRSHTEQHSDAPIATEALSENNEDSFDTVEIQSKPELASTGASGETYEQAARYVPNYVITDTNTIQPLYNPYTAQMLLDLSLDAYQISADNSEGWQRSLVDLGYTTRICVDGEKSYDIAEIDNGEGVPPTAISFNPFHAIIGIKKVVYNDQVKYAFVIAFRGTNSFGDLVDTDFNFIPTSEGFHSGFRNMSRDFLFYFRTKQFTLDGNTILGDDILKDMQSENSQYTMLVTGHSLGGAFTDILVGYDLYEMGVHPSNVMAYTFAAPTSAPSYYNYPYKNIINIINEDDFVPTVGASKRVGTDFRYTPDDAFRQKNYGDKYEAGHGTAWWSNIVNEAVVGGAFHFVSHKLDPVYNSILKYIENNIDEFTSYHTNGDNTWKYVLFTSNTFNSFKGSITTNSLKMNNSVITCKNLNYSWELQIDNECILNGNVNCSEDDYARLNFGRIGRTECVVDATLVVNGNCSCNDLLMESSQNYLLINGSFICQRGESPTLSFWGGTVECKDDFYCYKNTTFGVNNAKTVFSGSNTQRVYCSGFSHVSFKNPDIIFENDKIEFLLDENTTFSNPSVINVKRIDLVNCILTVPKDINLCNLNLSTSKLCCISGSVTTNSLKMNNSVITCKNLNYSWELQIDNECILNGNVNCSEDDYARLNFGRIGRTECVVDATLVVNGNCSCNDLLMESSQNYLLINGSFICQRGESPTLSFWGGTVECKGDFYCYKNTTFGVNNAKIVFSGDTTQRVQGEWYNIIEIKNTSKFGVVFENCISVKKLFKHNNNSYSLFGDGIGSTFMDYDGDGMLDHVDPYPTDPNNMPPVDKKRGDSDGDGEVTIIDATCIQRFLAQFDVFSFDEVTADADGDGEITILDATAVQRYLAQFENIYSIGYLIK